MSCIVITGASRGIGRCIASAFIQRGFPVALLSRQEESLNQVAHELSTRKEGPPILPIACDVSQTDQVETAVDHILVQLGPPLAIINNAGLFRHASVMSMKETEWDEIVATNLKGPFLITRAFLPVMFKQKKGRFIALSSISGTQGTPYLSAYCASKWGLIGFTKSLAEELRGTGLQALCILPGSVDTDMLKESGFYPPTMQPEEVARVVVYTAIDAPAAMNGSAIELFGP
ncbi:SDR family NAD(P)-dependent oxidoreductase [Pajaroellobacter abortibovis]|uniref:Ketoreductase domain-containing protein n=1 Tax=Pajaroellobacter abortibovis TaxID=1882918 RepID=A0A1L6MZG9_9BACT|nr:SDR family oxidoreductase [Pajaroellobacter abortibovis]APS00961.1 hypothetical protein BCY86_07785 [Pajaroellobacter abortibovis]